MQPAAKAFARLALETLADVCTKSKNDNARVAAATAILDRGYGKPVTQTELADWVAEGHCTVLEHDSQDDSKLIAIRFIEPKPKT